MVTLKARAKVNLFLHIIGKRDDGYHAIESLCCFADVADEITIAPAEKTDITVAGSFASAVNLDENSLLKALDFIRNQTQEAHNYKIHLTKNIPAGAGLGGGTADAAALIRYCLPTLPPEQTIVLGADVPVCTLNKAAIIRGIGENLAPIAIPALHALLIWPQCHADTKTIFQTYQADFSSAAEVPSGWDSTKDFIDFLKGQKNDLKIAACANHPEIKEALSVLEKSSGCLLSHMTGSGSCCFGIFETAEQTQDAAQEIQKSNSDWWVMPTILS